MRTRNALAAVATAAALAAACGGKDACPTAAANAEHQQTSGACSGTTQAVAIRLNLCEACSHTAPTCVPDLGSVAANGSGIVWLDMRWEICADNSSCSAKACGDVTCQFSVPAGNYNVQTTGVGGNVQFQLVTSASSATCSGQI